MDIPAQVNDLFVQAHSLFPDPKAHKLVKKARTLAMSKRYRLPSELRRQYCHSCYHLLIPGKNCTVRTKDGILEHHCLDCGRFNRLVL